MQLFMCMHVYSCSFKDKHVHRLWINLLLEFGSKTNEQNTMKNKFIWYLCFIDIVVIFVHSCHHCLKMSTIRLLAVNATNAFMILKSTKQDLEKIFVPRVTVVILKTLHPFKYFGLGSVMSFEWMKTSFSNCLPWSLAEMGKDDVLSNQTQAGWI